MSKRIMRHLLSEDIENGITASPRKFNVNQRRKYVYIDHTADPAKDMVTLTVRDSAGNFLEPFYTVFPERIEIDFKSPFVGTILLFTTRVMDLVAKNKKAVISKRVKKIKTAAK